LNFPRPLSGLAEVSASRQRAAFRAVPMGRRWCGSRQRAPPTRYLSKKAGQINEMEVAWPRSRSPIAVSMWARAGGTVRYRTERAQAEPPMNAPVRLAGSGRGLQNHGGGR